MPSFEQVNSLPAGLRGGAPAGEWRGDAVVPTGYSRVDEMCAGHCLWRNLLG
jgi:hypothetical protein